LQQKVAVVIVSCGRIKALSFPARIPGKVQQRYWWAGLKRVTLAASKADIREM
jgi:hypothetical protein